MGVREEVGTRGLDLMIWEGVCVDTGVCRPNVVEVTRAEVVGLAVEVKKWVRVRGRYLGVMDAGMLRTAGVALSMPG